MIECQSEAIFPLQLLCQGIWLYQYLNVLNVVGFLLLFFFVLWQFIVNMHTQVYTLSSSCMLLFRRWYSCWLPINEKELFVQRSKFDDVSLELYLPEKITNNAVCSCGRNFIQSCWLIDVSTDLTVKGVGRYK